MNISPAVKVVLAILVSNGLIQEQKAYRDYNMLEAELYGKPIDGVPVSDMIRLLEQEEGV